MSTATILAPRSLRARDRVRHHIDLGVDRIGAPDHDQIGLRHLARIGPGEPPGAGDEAGPGRIDADGREEAGIFLGVAQAVDAVAHHQAHRAGVEIGPHRFRAVLALGFQEFFGDEIERVVPGDRLERARAFRARAAQRLRQPVGMMDALGVARDLRADDAGRVGVVRRPRTRPMVRSSRSSTSSAQVEGQSCGQAEAPIRTGVS